MPIYNCYFLLFSFLHHVEEINYYGKPDLILWHRVAHESWEHQLRWYIYDFISFIWSEGGKDIGIHGNLWQFTIFHHSIDIFFNFLQSLLSALNSAEIFDSLLNRQQIKESVFLAKFNVIEFLIKINSKLFNDCVVIIVSVHLIIDLMN